MFLYYSSSFNALTISNLEKRMLALICDILFIYWLLIIY